jgi:hypothetical protein
MLIRHGRNPNILMSPPSSLREPDALMESAFCLYVMSSHATKYAQVYFLSRRQDKVPRPNQSIDSLH